MDTNVIQTTGGILHPQDITFITNCICDVFNCEPLHITELRPLQKGLSNSVLSFKYNGGKYVFRYPGLGSEVLIDRGRESIIQKQIEDAGVDDEGKEADEKGERLHTHSPEPSGETGMMGMPLPPPI